MQEHFGFEDNTYKRLLKQGVTPKDMMKACSAFCPFDKYKKPSFVSLYYVADKIGDFVGEKTKSPLHRIAHAYWKHKLDKKEQMGILEYIEFIGDPENDKLSS